MMTAEEYLNEDTTTTMTATTSNSMTEDIPSPMEVTTKKMQKLDLSSLEMFPSLGSTEEPATVNNNKKSAWGAGMNANVVSSVRRPTGMTTQVFQLPVEQQRRLKDSERITMAELCHLIGKETNTSIEASRSGQSQAITFVIRGAETQILQARRKIWARLAETLSIAMVVPEECLGGLIGPGGQRIKMIMEESSTKIMVPKPYAGELTISGDFEGISMAKQRIEGLINDRISKRTVNVAIEVPMLSFVFEVPVTTKVGGAAMMETFTAKYADLKMSIMLPKEDQAMAMVSISGDRHQVDLAQAELESRLVDVKQQVNHVSTIIHKNLHRFLIGPKGATLQAIEEETQCLVVVPPPGDASETIMVYGAKENLLKALQMILDKTGSVDCQTIGTSPEVRRLILHRSRTLLRDLESKYNVNIHSTSQSTIPCGIIVEGKKAEVAMAVMELTEMVSALTKTTHFDRLSVPGAYVKFLIGKKGSTLAQIQSDFAVDIIFDDANNAHGSATANSTEEEEMLLAATTKDSLTKAKEYITKKITDVADLRNVTLKIATNLHGLLIGPKGSNLKKYHDRYPSLLINFRAGDEVTLRGPSAEVMAAQEEMMKEADALKHDLVMHSYTTEAIINGDLQRVACDAGGQLTRHLMGLAKAADVKLSLSPQKDIISIQGLKKDAEAFKVILLEKLTRLADRSSETLSIDPAYHALLIGKGGKNVKHLAQKYDVRVDFPTKPGTSGVEESVDPSMVTLTGPKANLKDAKQELLDLVAYEKAHRQQCSFEIPEAMVPFILGKGGVILNEIQLECDDCNIDIGRDSNTEGMRTVSLEGTQEAMAMAKEKIMAIVAHRQSLLSEVICADALALKKLTGPGGRLYRLLCQKYDPMGVQITCRATSELTLRGKDPHFTQAKEELQALLTETSTFITEQVEVAVESHGDIVGPGGSNIRRLCAEHRVAIQVPRSKDTPMVTVEGSPASVATVKDILKVADSMQVPQPIHKHIIGPGGAIINTIRNETGCKIILPPPGSSSTTVELMGTTDSIAKAKEAITKIIQAHSK